MIKLEIVCSDFINTKPLSISFHTWNKRNSFLIFLHYDNLVGIGEANPFKPITGDSPEELIQDAKHIAQIDLNPKTDSLKALHEFLEQKIASHSLKAAIDAAYHDLLGKIKQTPVYQIYVKEPLLVQSAITIFVQNSLEETKIEANNLYQLYPNVKIVKIKLKGHQDRERAKIIKKVFANKVRFTLDANQAFDDPDKALSALEEIVHILENVILVEEPCPKNDLDKLKFIKENLKNTMTFADESAATLADVEKIAAAKAAHGVNIKLQKAGGIWPATQIANLCHQEKLHVMVGAMIEGPVSISTGAHFVASLKQAVMSDLDTDLDLPNFTQGHAVFENGIKNPNNAPGLGISLKMEAIKKLVVEQKMVFNKVFLEK